MAVLAENTLAVEAVALEVAQVVLAAFGDTGQHSHKHEDRRKHAEAELILAETVSRRNSGPVASLSQRSRMRTCCRSAKVVAFLSRQQPPLLQRSRRSVVAQLAVAAA